MLDITTAMPGASLAEVEEDVTLPIERLVHPISGVEYVYSTSSPGMSLGIVRFLVGTPQEDALIKVHSKLYSNFDQIPPGVSQPIIKARSIDDVPILSLTLWGKNVLFGTTNANAGAQKAPQQFPAVTVTLAKRKGTNATNIANAALKRIDEMKGVQNPNDVNVTTTRNYGDTAKAKSDELLEHLLLATISVTLLIALFLGWRESGVV